LSPAQRDAPLDAYFRLILDPDPAIHGPAARAWHDTERILSEAAPKATRLALNKLRTSHAVPATPFMEAHYFRNNCFLAPDQLMREAARLKGIPGIVVQGRYDLLCPPAAAHALAAVWPDAEVRVVENAGHSLYDPGVRDAVAKAIADLAAKG
jgi:proline iminopeptidase